MSKHQIQIDYHWLTNPTGDPMLDVGGYVLKTLFADRPGEDIYQLIEEVTKHYVKHWDSKLHAFFLNSILTQSIHSDIKKIEKICEYYGSLLEGRGGMEGYCRITGRRTLVYNAGRDLMCLAGSKSFTNFHQGMELGLKVSGEIIIRSYFMPLGCMILQGKIGIISSNDPDISTFFVQKNLRQNLQASADSEESNGIVRSKYIYPETVFYEFIKEMSVQINLGEKFTESIPSKSLSLFHFTNFGSSPSLEIHHMPFHVYAFILDLLNNHHWVHFINNHYESSKYRPIFFDVDANTYYLETERGIIKIDPEEKYLWRNVVLRKLAAGRSLVPDILNWSIKYYFPFNLLMLYQMKIRFMERKTLEKIDEMAMFIVMEKNIQNIRKRIYQLNAAKNAGLFRQFLIREIISKNFKKSHEKPILTMEEYANYLPPDKYEWSEIRDLLLIAIYEKLHQHRNIIPELGKKND